MDAAAMITALEDLIGTMQGHLSALKADPSLADSERWIESVEDDAHWATDFQAYANTF